MSDYDFPDILGGEDYESTPLMAAYIDGNTEILRYLIDQGVNVNLTDKDGRTALHHTANRDSVDAIKCLLDIGAEVDARDNEGMTPLMIACDILFNLHVRFNLDVATHLVTRGANINLKKNADVATLLVTRGANIILKDNAGRTALQDACLHCLHYDEENQNLVEFLLNSGAEVNVQDEHGTTPLMEACEARAVGAVTSLIQHHADMNLENNKGDSALLEANEYFNFF